ncbi:MAG: hypothetical protein NTV98_04645, partial [Candidatus Roizmanbacteria bacterium]|nr:hypothetical protein [Candidatus Roizmanbacteria bacterium]
SHILAPFPYRNAADQVIYAISEGGIATSRSANLTRYLENGMPDKQYQEKDIEWGRSVFSEIVAVEVLRRTLPIFDDCRQIELRHAPTAFDRSTPSFDSPHYQKGGDLLIFENWGPEKNPLLLIDVTTGTRNEIKEKENKLGLNTLTEMPVVVFPIAEVPLLIGGHDSLSPLPFAQTLEHLKNDFIKTNGKLRFQITHESKLQIKEMVLNALKKTKGHLAYIVEKPVQQHAVQAKHAFEKIEYLESIIS